MYSNGTRLRNYTNGTLAFLKLDLTIDNVIKATDYNFASWIDCTGTNCTTTVGVTVTNDLTAIFSAKNPNETLDNYKAVRRFDNGTVWWYPKQCTYDADGSFATGT